MAICMYPPHILTVVRPFTIVLKSLSYTKAEHKRQEMPGHIYEALQQAISRKETKEARIRNTYFSVKLWSLFGSSVSPKRGELFIMMG
jgi:hypothetical protein